MQEQFTNLQQFARQQPTQIRQGVIPRAGNTDFATFAPIRPIRPGEAFIQPSGQNIPGLAPMNRIIFWQDTIGESPDFLNYYGYQDKSIEYINKLGMKMQEKTQSEKMALLKTMATYYRVNNIKGFDKSPYGVEQERAFNVIRSFCTAAGVPLQWNTITRFLSTWGPALKLAKDARRLYPIAKIKPEFAIIGLNEADALKYVTRLNKMIYSFLSLDAPLNSVDVPSDFNMEINLIPEDVFETVISRADITLKCLRFISHLSIGDTPEVRKLQEEARFAKIDNFLARDGYFMSQLGLEVESPIDMEHAKFYKMVLRNYLKSVKKRILGGSKQFLYPTDRKVDVNKPQNRLNRDYANSVQEVRQNQVAVVEGVNWTNVVPTNVVTDGRTFLDYKLRPEVIFEMPHSRTYANGMVLKGIALEKLADLEVFLSELEYPPNDEFTVTLANNQFTIDPKPEANEELVKFWGDRRTTLELSKTIKKI